MFMCINKFGSQCEEDPEALRTLSSEPASDGCWESREEPRILGRSRSVVQTALAPQPCARLPAPSPNLWPQQEHHGELSAFLIPQASKVCVSSTFPQPGSWSDAGRVAVSPRTCWPSPGKPRPGSSDGLFLWPSVSPGTQALGPLLPRGRCTLPCCRAAM